MQSVGVIRKAPVQSSTFFGEIITCQNEISPDSKLIESELIPQNNEQVCTNTRPAKLLCSVIGFYSNFVSQWIPNLQTMGHNPKMSCYCCLKGHPLQVGHKQDRGRQFILSLPQAAIPLRSNVGNDVKPALSFVIQNR